MRRLQSVSSPLDRLAEQIRAEHHATQENIKTTLGHAMRCGQLLVEAKALVGHGNWLPWLAKKCRLSRNSAQVYMRLYRNFGDQKASAVHFSIRDALKLLAKTQDDQSVPGDDYLAPPLPVVAVSRRGDLWQLGDHRVLCGDATDPLAVARLLGDRKPRLMITDPPYGVQLDSGWRNVAGVSEGSRDSPGHTETKMLGDSRADWSEAFALVPSIQVAYLWHASVFTREVLDGLLRLGFLYHQQIIWTKDRSVFGRTHYSFQHEPCWYARKRNAQWYGSLGENSTIWTATSPKAPGSEEPKYDHPSQKPLELFRRPIMNHTRPGELVIDLFLGSGTAIAAAEATERVALGLELDPRHVDVSVLRWQELSGRQATLAGRSFEDVARKRLGGRRRLSGTA